MDCLKVLNRVSIFGNLRMCELLLILGFSFCIDWRWDLKPSFLNCDWEERIGVKLIVYLKLIFIFDTNFEIEQYINKLAYFII